MRDHDDKPPAPGPAARKDRQDRLRQALRENLKRRRQQLRGRDGSKNEGFAEPAGTEPEKGD